MIKIARCCVVTDGRNRKEELDKEIDEKAGDKEQALFSEERTALIRESPSRKLHT
ncbi:MAG: hypothetical protein M3261_06150 [Thermoproteota archaeon]|nr:hypothetical protein [Thermoproteota archaeon]